MPGGQQATHSMYEILEYFLTHVSTINHMLVLQVMSANQAVFLPNARTPNMCPCSQTKAECISKCVLTANIYLSYTRLKVQYVIV